MTKLIPLKENMHGHKRNPYTSVHDPYEFFVRAKDLQLGDVISPDLYVFDAQDNRIPLWHIVGRMIFASSTSYEVIFCLENLQHELIPRTPQDAPLTIALLLTQERILRTKEPYHRVLFPDLSFIAERLKEPQSKATVCVCPFLIPVNCKRCGTSMFVTSHPKEAYEHRYCVICTRILKKEHARKRKAPRAHAS